ncbi:tetratricopeptide repeat protein [Marinimicrobium koreense]|uniref:tetratricopeptide repeat protein n=1 Tax=Marinimicrobium koreense TaxID=306545 RepID=UPI003F727BBD
MARFAQNHPPLQQEAYSLILQSHLDQQRYAEAEQVARQLLSLPALSDETRSLTEARWSLSVYRQAEQAERRQEWDAAIDHFRRIHEAYPDSDNAARGLYNALSLAGEYENWGLAIALIQRFQTVYPEHELRVDAGRQLSTAYLASGQTDRAARQYERLAGTEQDGRAQRAAQWKAAQLYLEQGDRDAAINAFRRYAHRYPNPYPENAEAMNHLVTLYTQSGEPEKRAYWQQQILIRDRQQPGQARTDRTRRLAATAALGLGRDHHEHFKATRLSLPLDRSLSEKTGHMQNAIQHYARAASYGLTDIASESTHQIGRIYETLARDLLESDRPTELSDEALMQYNILLEDRAFPFEDKAIEFYERNLRRVASVSFNDWLAKSRERLAVLFPVRYDRPAKMSIRFPKMAESEKPNHTSEPITNARLEADQP